MGTDPGYRARLRTKNEKSNKRIRGAIRQLVLEFKSLGCATCDERAESCMVAHHLDRATKELTIGNAVGRLQSPKKVAEELPKCICVSANCHAKIHAGLIECPGLPTRA